MPHTIQSKQRLLARIRRIKGQATSIEHALQEEHNCHEILQQLAAIRGAVNGLMMEVLEGHLRVHVISEVESPEQKQQYLDQVVKVMRTYMK